MKRRRHIQWWLYLILLLWMAALGCSRSTDSRSSERPAPRQKPSSLRNLQLDEEHGGHTLARHVGRSDDQLRERLSRERNIRSASTYTDRAAAEEAVGAAIQAAQDRIDRWLGRQGGRINLVLDYDATTPIGRTLHRGASSSEPCSHAKVVLKAAEDGYYVLTSYPEC